MVGSERLGCLKGTNKPVVRKEAIEVKLKDKNRTESKRKKWENRSCIVRHTVPDSLHKVDSEAEDRR